MGKPVYRVVTAVISHDGRYLITQRRREAVLPLLWEFPGGAVKEGESDAEALEREIRERLGVSVGVGEKWAERLHEYPGYTVELALYECEIPFEFVPRPLRVNDLRWVTSGELELVEFPAADQATVAKLIGRFRE